MNLLAVLSALAYLGLLAAKHRGGVDAELLDNLAFALEIALDLQVIALAYRVARDGADLATRHIARWIGGSFLCSAISSSNWRVLSKIYLVKLKSTMGTPLELEINVPYVGCYLLGAVALYRLGQRDARPPKLGWALSVLVLAGALAGLVPALRATGNPVQNQVLHVACFVVSSIVVGFAASLVIGGATDARLAAAGYAGLAVSGYLFQITEIHAGVDLDLAMDLTWTLGQFAVLAALLKARAATRGR